MPPVPDQRWWWGQPHATALETLESPVVAIERKPPGVECITRRTRRNDSRRWPGFVHHEQLLTARVVRSRFTANPNWSPSFTGAVLISRRALAPSIRGHRHRIVSSRTRRPPHSAAPASRCVPIDTVDNAARERRQSSRHVFARSAPTIRARKANGLRYRTHAASALCYSNRPLFLTRARGKLTGEGIPHGRPPDQCNTAQGAGRRTRESQNECLPLRIDQPCGSRQVSHSKPERPALHCAQLCTHSLIVHGVCLDRYFSARVHAAKEAVCLASSMGCRIRRDLTPAT